MRIVSGRVSSSRMRWPELPRLLPALRGQRPELVRLTRRGLRVAHEIEAHCR